MRDQSDGENKEIISKEVNTENRSRPINRYMGGRLMGCGGIY